MKRLRAFTKESLSNDEATSKCTALTDRQVKMTPYLFTVVLPLLTSKGPKKSTPTQVNGGSSAEILSWGRSAIRWCPGAAFNLQQTTHFDKILLIAVLAPGIQNLWRNLESMWLWPPWPVWRCMSWRMRSEMWSSLASSRMLRFIWHCRPLNLRGQLIIHFNWIQEEKWLMKRIITSICSLAWTTFTEMTGLTSGLSNITSAETTGHMGQLTSGWTRNSGPNSQKLALREDSTLTPLDAKSAGLLDVFTYLHWEYSDDACISETRFATNVLNRVVLFPIYFKIEVLSVQKN